jgi:hypothetical protein
MAELTIEQLAVGEYNSRKVVETIARYAEQGKPLCAGCVKMALDRHFMAQDELEQIALALRGEKYGSSLEHVNSLLKFF